MPNFIGYFISFGLTTKAMAHEALRERQMPEPPLRPLANRLVGFRHDPRRGALKQLELCDARLDLWHELDRARAGADHRDALAVERIVMVPARRVEQFAGKAFEAGDPRQCRP
jgi:hypothetical protein